MNTRKQSSVIAVKFVGALMFFAFDLPGGTLTPLYAQETKPKAKKLPPRETTTLQTKDGVQLRCDFYPGTNGKETVPVMLLHGWEGPRGQGNSTDFEGLALYLQRAGHAVLVPTFRGHPGSTQVETVAGVVEFDREKMGGADLAAMVRFDLEAAKKFLVKKHNEEQLNIEMLCVVGAEMGAVVGINWIAQDWSWPSLPGLKQGQDVKAMVLISPSQSFKGFPTRRALAHPAIRNQISAMIVYGRNQPKVASDGRRIHTSLKRFRRAVGDDPEEQRRHQTLYLTELDTSLQGTKMLSSPGLNLPQMIDKFIQLRLVQKRDLYPWQSRRKI